VRRLIVTLSASLACATLSFAAAADYPERAVTVIVPFSTGGGTDTGSRTWGRYLEECLGGAQPVIIQNQPGAGGQIGFAQISSMPADGYTLGALNMPNVVLGAITRPDPAYTLDSFDFLGTFYGSRTTLSVRDESEIHDLAELFEQARQSEQPIKVAISGIGSDDHLLTLKLAKLADVEFDAIPFGDSAGTIVALLGGHADLATLNIVTAARNSDDVRALAVASEKPAEDLPGVPTFREEGIQLVNGTTHVIGAPSGLPPDVKAKLTGCFKQIAADPNFVADIEKLALMPTPMNAAETAEFVQDEAKTLKALWDADPWE
jgi:tripartite-type tricarboxylate transporter receptor subunit TctC